LTKLKTTDLVPLQTEIFLEDCGGSFRPARSAVESEAALDRLDIRRLVDFRETDEAPSGAKAFLDKTPPASAKA
jgi:hypothetical protein